MELRKEFIPEVDIAKGKHKNVMRLIQSIEAAQENNESAKAQSFLTELNEYVDKEYDLYFFYEYWGWTTLDELAFKVALPSPPLITNITKEELTEVVNKLREPERDIVPTEGIGMSILMVYYYVDLIERNYPVTQLTNWIYYDNLPADEIVDRIISSKPILL